MQLDNVMRSGCNKLVTCGGMNNKLWSSFNRMRKLKIVADGRKKESLLEDSKDLRKLRTTLPRADKTSHLMRNSSHLRVLILQFHMIFHNL